MKVLFVNLVEADTIFDFVVKNNKLAFDDSWKIMELRDQWKKHMDIYNLEREKIFNKYAEDNGTGKILPRDKIMKFENEVLDYLDQEVEVGNLKKIPYAILKNCEVTGNLDCLKEFVKK